MNRRQFLAAAALTGLASACGSAPASDPAAFRTQLRVPPLLEPEIGEDGTRTFALTMRRGRTELLPGRPAETWGFNGPHLGPTIRAARGDKIRMTVTNRLAETSTVHWHGMRLPARMDGGPHQPIEPGATWSPHWTVDQPAATSWYHPHPHGATARHVYRGLAGMFIIEDGSKELPSRYGVDDLPLILQDKNFAADGSPTGDPLKGTFGILGDHMLVNGTYQGFVHVRTERVRFRILNGSNARMYHLAFADDRPFHVVGNDAGLLAAPVEVDRVSLSPGERVEVVVAFTGGEQVLLRTVSGSDDIDEGDFDLVKIVAAPRLAASPRLPGHLTGAPAPIAVPPDATVRRFRLNGHDAINGKEMDMARIDEVIPAGAVEIWEIENTVYAHNFHIHEVAFQVLDVAGSPPEAWASGPKDTVYVPPKSTVRLAVRFGTFTDPATPYMYHCHILRHEDSGMMGQFVIVEPGTEHQVSRTITAHHHP